MIETTNKMRKGLLAAMSLCATLCMAENGVPDNGEIRSLYSRKEDELVARFQDWKKLSPNEVAPMALGIGALRTPKLTDIFLDLTDYDPFRPPKAYPPGIDPVMVLTGPKCYGAGPDTPSKLRYPFFEALLRIGVPFSKCVDHYANYEGQRRTDALFNLSCLAQISGGAFFNAYYSSATNRWNRDAIHWVSKAILPAPLARIIPKPDAYFSREYDKWQDVLVSRFQLQIASGDAELADTIYTMGFIRSDRAMPLLIDNLTVCPQVSTNAPSGFVFPAAEALASIAPPLGICFEKLEATAQMSLEESLWLRITHEDYPEALEYDLMKKAEAGDARAKRLLQALPWRRLEKE